MVDYKRKIEELETEINSKKVMKARYEERLSTLEIEKKKILEELSVYGISVTDLDKWLVKEEEEISKDLDKCTQILKI